MLRNPGRVGAVEVSCSGACRTAPAWPCHFKRFRGAAECGASAVSRVVRVAQHASSSVKRLALVVLLSALPAVALVPPAHAERPRSVGTASSGRLVDGFEVPLSGKHHRFYGPVRSRGTNFATLEMAALLARAARVVAGALGGPPLVIADISKERGGDVGRHVSHNSGRDVDVLFYVFGSDGEPTRARGFYRFDGQGRCTSPKCQLRIDWQRTWWFARTLLVSRLPAVQYVFVSGPIKRGLLRYAERHGEHPELLARAKVVLRQPVKSSPHDDHFHVRTYCTPGDRDNGCRDTGRRWPWVQPDGRADALPAPGSR